MTFISTHPLRGRKRTISIAAAALLSLALVYPTLASAAIAVPADLQAAILLRSLRYERTFRDRGGSATLVVVGDGSSRRDAERMARAFDEVASEGTAGRPLRVTRVVASDASGLAAQLRQVRPDVVYVTPGTGHAVAANGLRNASGIVLCGETPERQAECVVGVTLSRSRPRLVVHLQRARQRGLTFDARLLQLSDTVR